MAGIRTVMVTTPAMLSDLIKRLALGRVELDVVAELGGRQGLARRLRQLRPDLVVVGLRRSETGAVITALLPLLPKTKFIVLSQNGHCIVGYQLRFTRTRLADLSPEAFIRFIQPDKEEVDI